MKAIHAAELEALLETDRPIEILDLRSRSDFQNGHIDGAHSLPAPEISPVTILLSRQLLPTEPVYLVSQSGALARLTACDLERHGLDNLVVVAGGMHAWRHDGFPVVGAGTADD